MATRRVVPREDLEGSIGSGEKRWEKAYVGNVGNVYDTVADMVDDLELREGATVETKGKNSLNDGLAAKYSIREKLVSDVEDGDVIIFLDNGNVAEKIITETDTKLAETSDEVDDINDELDSINTDIEAINTELEGTVTKTLYGCPNYIQDAALYNNKLFAFGGNKQMKVYDWITKELIGTFTVGGAITSHFNSATWGHKQNDSDPYPLLYSSGYNGYEADGTTVLPAGTCQVYKINSDYSSDLVQDIRIGFLTDELWAIDGTSAVGSIGYGDFIADPDNNKLYVIKSCAKNSIGFTRVFVFALPDTSSANVTLAKTDVLEYYDLPYYSYPQGATYKDNKIYFVFGIESQEAKQSGLVVIDVKQKKQIGYVPLFDIMTEPEAVVIDNNVIYIAQSSFYSLSAIPYNTNIGDMGNLSDIGANNVTEALKKVAEVANFNQSRIVENTSASNMGRITSITMYLNVTNYSESNLATLVCNELRRVTGKSGGLFFVNCLIFKNPGFVSYLGFINLTNSTGRFLYFGYGGFTANEIKILSYVNGSLYQTYTIPGTIS